MTDITELAQEARINAGCGEYLSPAETMELVEVLEKAQQRIAELENYAEAEAVGADRAAEDGVYWMKRCKELESRTVKLTDINEYLAEVHDKTLNRAFRLLAEGVRAGDVAAMRAAGIKVEAE